MNGTRTCLGWHLVLVTVCWMLLTQSSRADASKSRTGEAAPPPSHHRNGALTVKMLLPLKLQVGIRMLLNLRRLQDRLKRPWYPIFSLEQWQPR